MIVGKNSAQCHHNSGDLTAKKFFIEILLDLVGINFRNRGTSIDPGHRRAAPAMFSTSATCCLNNLHQPRSRHQSIRCDLANVKKQFRNFGRPLGLLVIADNVFDVGNMPFERSPESAVSSGAAAVRHQRGAFIAISLT